jgi:hypothetical protein
MAICDACAATVSSVTSIAPEYSLCESCLSVRAGSSPDALDFARSHLRTGSWSLDIELADRVAAQK